MPDKPVEVVRKVNLDRWTRGQRMLPGTPPLPELKVTQVLRDPRERLGRKARLVLTGRKDR